MTDRRVAVVTGANRGIGFEVCRQLARRGIRVVLTSRDPAKGKAAVGKLADEGLKADYHRLEVTDAKSISSLIAFLEQQYGRADILVNNAGVLLDPKGSRVLASDIETYRATLETNFFGPLRLVQALAPLMKKHDYGRIVNLASVVALSGNAGQANYAAAKAGIIGFTKSLAREVGSRGITVNAVAPGLITTDMTAALPESQREQLALQISLGRLGKPEEVAAVVAFLASPSAGYITGETVNVNGGMYMA